MNKRLKKIKGFVLEKLPKPVQHRLKVWQLTNQDAKLSKTPSTGWRAIPWYGILGAGATNHSSGKWYLPNGIERKRDLTPAILDSQKEILQEMYDEVFK
jgi:hypothetical protein